MKQKECVALFVATRCQSITKKGLRRTEFIHDVKEETVKRNLR